MKSKILIFAPKGKDRDDALLCTRWMADRTMSALEQHTCETTAVLDEDATRNGLEVALTQDVAGIAFFSHGRRAETSQSKEDGQRRVVDHAIMGMDGPAFDRENLHLAKGRWAHAVACHAGNELAALACAHGAECFVGYEGTLSVEWHPEALPADVEPLVMALVTRTTCNLAMGVRDARRLRADVNEIAEDITAWCMENPERAEGLFLEVTAQQLVNRLVYRCSP
jgi:hypothetical protein